MYVLNVQQCVKHADNTTEEQHTLINHSIKTLIRICAGCENKSPKSPLYVKRSIPDETLHLVQLHLVNQQYETGQ